ncbi:hypothetical protein Cgig2_026567 [Carnegiea gigantea]|uniref:Myb-like domain-containing protein n=1 Tax=Carnegiea gigantea TaxID=171969 RepID=A0A9Q1JZK1_9CARY|nr:hypothetical protein Cgig2_026567 [Carnegiea gigantea]
MQGTSGTPEISGERRENQPDGSVSVAKAVSEERENEENGEEGVIPAPADAVGDRFSPANRWPQEETLALLSIRSEMDIVFRQSGSKTPLWDQVSRRMAEHGYDRSAKKCKEKFENIYKYHKRLKNCSYSRPSGKTYRFFDQLEALDHHQASLQALVPEQDDTAVKDTTLSIDPILSNPPNVPQIAMPISVNFDSSPITTSTSTTYTSGSESEGLRKKRKWADFFGELMKCVLEKQEDLQKKFLEAIDKCENERIAREEAWKAQEIARIKREQELLMQERSISAAKDAAVLAFLQKILEQHQDPVALGQMEGNPGQEMSIMCRNERHSGENPSSRWPKEEVEALIRIRSNMELNDQGGGPKGPLWEEISMAMKRMGYVRSAKRCKEKWENINKYYRRVKDSSKLRPVESKTCPYFHLLDDLYSMKTKRLDNSSEGAGCNLRPEELLMHMMNHHHSGQRQGQAVLQQEEGQLIMAQESSHDGNHNHSEDEDKHVEDEQGDYESVAKDPSPMNIME